MCYTVLACSKQYLHNKKWRPNKKHRCGAGQILSKGQVRTSHHFRVPEQCKLCVPWFVRVLGFYNGKGLTSFPRCRILFLIRFYANIFYKTLSLQESLGSTWNVGLKIFPYTSFLAIHARNMLVPLASTRQLYLVSLTSSALLLRWPLTHTLTMMFLSILVWTCPFGIDCKAINEFISYHKIVNLGPGR